MTKIKKDKKLYSKELMHDLASARAEMFLRLKPAYLKTSYDVFRKYYKKSYPRLAIPNRFCFEESRKKLRSELYPANKPIAKIAELNVVKNSIKSYGFVSGSFSRKYTDQGLHVVMPCFHAPHHNSDFYSAFVRFLKERKNEIVALHIIGDFLDMQALSSHDLNNISTNTLDREYKTGNAIIDEITGILSPNILKTYIWGNHEDRYNRYMKNVNNAKLGGALQSPTEGLKLLARGFHVYENWKQSYITIGEHLTLCHGEFVNIHTAKKHIDTYRKSVMYAHTHRKQVYIEGNTGGFNIGAMANFDDSAFGYASRAMKNSWVNSFSTVFIDAQGYYHVEIPSWVNNRFIYGGKIYL